MSTAANYTFTINSDRVLVANFVSTLPTVARPSILPACGRFRKKVKMTMRDATSGAQIYYTINGPDPTTSSALYSKPVKVKGSGTYVVKAKAFKTGYNASNMVTVTFTIR